MNEYKLPKIFNWQTASNNINDCKCCEEVYTTGIANDLPFLITPYMISTCTSVINTTPTGADNLKSYKILGSYYLDTTPDNFVVAYIGTIQTVMGNTLYALPLKTSGSAISADAPLSSALSICAFANGATLQDGAGNTNVPAESMYILFDQPVGDYADLYLVISSDTAVNGLFGTIVFEYEFLETEQSTITFTRY